MEQQRKELIVNNGGASMVPSANFKPRVEAVDLARKFEGEAELQVNGHGLFEPEEKDLLQKALALGYFSSPPQIDLEGLAIMLKIKESLLAQMLSSINNKIIIILLFHMEPTSEKL